MNRLVRLPDHPSIPDPTSPTIDVSEDTSTMNNTTTGLGRRAAALAAAFTVGAAGLFAAVAPVAPAQAADPAPVSVIDPDATGTISVHRFDTSVSTDHRANGLVDPELSNVTGSLADAAVQGAKYFIYNAKAVDGTAIDLTTEAGWTKLAALSEAPVPADWSTYTSINGTDLDAIAPTGADGSVTYGATGSGLTIPVGAYWLVEDLSGVAPTDESLEVMQPILVTVPFTNPTTKNTWEYDVHVYPKTTHFAITKTASDNTVIGAGNPFTWTITADVPDTAVQGASGQLVENQTLDAFHVTDRFNGQLLSSPTVKVTAQYADPAIDDEVLTKDTHYTVTPAANPDEEDSVTITFAPFPTETSDDEKLQLLLASTVKIELTGTILPAAVGIDLDGTAYLKGDVADKATSYYKMTNRLDQTDPDRTTEQTLTTDEDVVTKWTPLQIRKNNPNGGVVLGAKFSIYQGTDAAAATAAAKSMTESALVKVDGKTVFETADSDGVPAEGYVDLSGLRQSNWAGNQLVSSGEANYRHYCVREVEAPEGLELSPEIKCFDLLSGDKHTVTFSDPNARGGFMLPLAGGAGIAGLSAVGLITIAMSVYAFRQTQASRTRRED